MRLSEQTALILGIVMLVLIGVYVSTRISVKEKRRAALAVSQKNILRIEDLPVNPRIPKEGKRVSSVTREKKIIHTILSNENLSIISMKYYGDASKWGKIYDANRNCISDPNSLQVGQELLIPDISA